MAYCNLYFRTKKKLVSISPVVNASLSALLYGDIHLSLSHPLIGIILVDDKKEI